MRITMPVSQCTVTIIKSPETCCGRLKKKKSVFGNRMWRERCGVNSCSFCTCILKCLCHRMNDPIPGYCGTRGHTERTQGSAVKPARTATLVNETVLNSSVPAKLLSQHGHTIKPRHDQNCPATRRIVRRKAYYCHKPLEF